MEALGKTAIGSAIAVGVGHSDVDDGRDVAAFGFPRRFEP
jgi:hypothetical protein